MSPCKKLVTGVISLEGAYVGSKGIEGRILAARQRAGSRPGQHSGSPALDALCFRDLCRRRRIFERTTRSKESWRSESWHGLSFLSSYAFAKSIDNLSSDVQGFSSQDPNNNNGEKGVSDYDVKHRFVTSANYALPFGRAGAGVDSRLCARTGN